MISIDSNVPLGHGKMGSSLLFWTIKFLKTVLIIRVKVLSYLQDQKKRLKQKVLRHLFVAAPDKASNAKTRYQTTSTKYFFIHVTRQDAFKVFSIDQATWEYNPIRSETNVYCYPFFVTAVNDLDPDWGWRSTIVNISISSVKSRHCAVNTVNPANNINCFLLRLTWLSTVDFLLTVAGDQS